VKRPAGPARCLGLRNCAGAASMIFDTDILIWCFRGNRRALEMIGSDQERALSIVSFI
jgi:hypothetical protein